MTKSSVSSAEEKEAKRRFHEPLIVQASSRPSEHTGEFISYWMRLFSSLHYIIKVLLRLIFWYFVVLLFCLSMLCYRGKKQTSTSLTKNAGQFCYCRRGGPKKHFYERHIAISNFIARHRNPAAALFAISSIFIHLFGFWMCIRLRCLRFSIVASANDTDRWNATTTKSFGLIYFLCRGFIMMIKPIIWFILRMRWGKHLESMRNTWWGEPHKNTTHPAQQ